MSSCMTCTPAKTTLLLLSLCLLRASHVDGAKQGPLSNSRSWSVSPPSEPGSCPLSKLPSVTVRACRGPFPCVMLCAIAAAQALLVSEARGLPQDHAGGRTRSCDLNHGLPESGGLHVKSFEQSPPSFPTKPYLTPALLGLLSLSWSPFPPPPGVSGYAERGWSHGNHLIVNSDSNPLLTVLCLPASSFWASVS